MKDSIRIFTAFTCFMFLQGCVPAVFVAGAAAGGSVIYDNRGMKIIVEDRNIVSQAEQRLASDKALKTQAHVVITTLNHNVLLAGQAPTKELSDEAERLVKAMSKVNVVYNEIAIEDPTAHKVRAHDAWLTTKIKTLLLAEKNLRSTQIKILTENSVVYVLGLVTRGQGDLATDKIRQIDGVEKVVKLFEYIG